VSGEWCPHPRIKLIFEAGMGHVEGDMVLEIRLDFIEYGLKRSYALNEAACQW